MNSLQLNSNETIYYQYQPESDELAIRLEPGDGPTRDEPIAELPQLSLSRDASTGAVVGLRVASVQQMILQNLVRDLFALARPYLDAAPVVVPEAAPVEPLSSPAEPEVIEAAEADAQQEAPTSASADTAEPAAELPDAESAPAEESQTPAKRARSSRRSSKKTEEPKADETLETSIAAVTEELSAAAADTQPVETQQDAGEATVEAPAAVVEEKPAKPARSRRKKTAKDDEAAPVAEAEGAEEAPAKPRRTRRKKSDAASDAAPAAEVAASAAEQASEAAIADSEQPAPKPARRSRRKSPKSDESGETIVEAVSEAAVEPDTVPAEEAKRPARRGRRKKQEPVVEEAAAASAETEPEVVGSETEPPLVPGAAEGASPVEAEVDYQAAPESGESEETPAESAPAEGQGRSRRRRRGKGKAAAAEESDATDVEAVDAAEQSDEAVADQGTDEEEEIAADAEATTTEEGDKPTKRKRRRRKKRGAAPAESASAVTAAAAAEAPPSRPRAEARPHRQPSSGERRGARSPQSHREKAAADGGTTRQQAPSRAEETDAVETRPSYKTAPIPGLEAPEAFGSMNMNSLLGQAIAAMGFEEPTPIQARAVPVAMQGKDVIGLAQTGTGKTMAFLIPAMHRMLADKNQEHRPRLLVLEPTRELAVQVAEEAEYLATHTDLRISTIYGGVGMKQQIDELRRGADVIVATPGRLQDHLNRNNVKLNSVQVLVLDEADRMLDMGFLPEIRMILARVPRDRQTLMFSATMPPAIQSLSLDFQREPEIIEVARQLPPAAIEQSFYPVERHLKTPLLIHLLQDNRMTSVLVFTETKSEADVVARKLKEAGLRVAIMHGDRNQRERESALQSLREGSVQVLVATDVAARGLDISDISHVINYDMPQSVDDYVHRIGRTARGTAAGRAYSFISSGDRGMVMRIESALGRSLPRVEAEDFDYDVPTPSWAKPSAEDIIQSLNSPKGIADRFRGMMKRR